MASYPSCSGKESLFVAVDVHLRTWQVTGQTEEEELFSRGIPGRLEALVGLLGRYRSYDLTVVYEAGYSGFWLHDALVERGIKCIVTPPSLVPVEYGNRVKTDRRDSRKLARLLAKGLLKSVYVPTREESSHRQVIRCRRQLVRDRSRVKNRIKSLFLCYGIEFPRYNGRWSQVFLNNLRRINLPDRYLAESYERMLDEYESLSPAIERQDKLLRELSKTDKYRDRVRILTSIPGVGLIAAMEMLLELQEMARFSNGDQLAAYVGLTPCQYSSGDKVRLGRITRIGKSHLRGVLVECAWSFIRRDPSACEVYTRIKARRGSKRAAVAVARRLLILARRLLLENRLYSEALAA